MSQDTLSDLLRTVRLRSALFFDLSCAGRWLAEAPGSTDIAAMVMPEVDQVIDYHVVTGGECWIAIQGEQPLRLRHGDIVILPQGDFKILLSANGIAILAFGIFPQALIGFCAYAIQQSL